MIDDNGEPTPQKQALLPPWQPGQSGNPAGRPKGSRNRLSERFIEAMHDDFVLYGVKVIEAVRAESPRDYLKLIAAIIPKEFHIKDQTLEDMSDDELVELLAAVRSIAAAHSAKQAGNGTGEAGRKTPPKDQLN